MGLGSNRHSRNFCRCRVYFVAALSTSFLTLENLSMRATPIFTSAYV